MKNYVHLWQYLAEFFLWWQIFQTWIVYFMFDNFMHVNRALYEIMWKNYNWTGHM